MCGDGFGPRVALVAAACSLAAAYIAGNVVMDRWHGDGGNGGNGA